MTIFGDWGTSRLRLFRTGPSGIVDRLDGRGIGQLADVSAVDALAETLAPWRDDAIAAGVRLCGMAGSRGGLIDVPYVACPAGADAWRAGFARTSVAGAVVSVAPGLSGRNFAGRADVMRGEETQIYGATALDPDLHGDRALVVLPGTHSKWVVLEHGRIVRFQTFATGEMFALLRDHSVLTRAGTDPAGRNEGFGDGLVRVRAGVLAGLFEARAAQLVEARTHGWALGLLSGLLIGAEFAEAAALLGGNPATITLIGDPDLCTLYERAAEGHAIPMRRLDGDACAIAGLSLLKSVETA